jgi:hypothetical protein
MPRNSGSSLVVAILALIVQQAVFPTPASADRKYFVETYTPYLDPAGELELETWITSRSGQQGPTGQVAWDWREEIEYALTNRLMGSAYLNFTRLPGEALKFTSPSLELIYRLADPGRLPGDPAVYLETTESGDELELEPKFLLAHRARGLVGAINLIGEFGFRHNDEETLGNGAVLRKEWAWEVSGGTAYELTPKLAMGLEALYRAEYPNFGPREGAALSLGPTINLQAGKVQLGLGALRQLRGSPPTSGHLNLADFERTEVRAIFGAEF